MSLGPGCVCSSSSKSMCIVYVDSCSSSGSCVMRHVSTGASRMGAIRNVGTCGVAITSSVTCVVFGSCCTGRIGCCGCSLGGRGLLDSGFVASKAMIDSPGNVKMSPMANSVCMKGDGGGGGNSMCIFSSRKGLGSRFRALPCPTSFMFVAGGWGCVRLGQVYFFMVLML